VTLPTRVRVGRTWYAVEVVQEYGELTGALRPREKRIIIARRSGVTKQRYTQAQRKLTFMHELVHAMLHELGRHKLNKDEHFVDDLAKLLSTLKMKFDDDFDVEKWKRENL
jgi:hypothetical protein